MTGMSRLTVLVLDGPGTAHLMLAGELDRTTAAELDSAVTTALAHPAVERIVVDVALLGFCDSGGLSALIAAALHAADQHVLLHLDQIRPPLERILRVAKLDRLLCPPGRSAQ